MQRSPKLKSSLPSPWTSLYQQKLGCNAPLKHTPPHKHTHRHTTQLPNRAQGPPACIYPKGSLCEGGEQGLLMTSLEIQPVISCLQTTLCPMILHHSCFARLQVEMRVTPHLRSSCIHTSQQEGSGYLSPEMWGQLLLLAPCPSVPQSWPLTSSLLLGSWGSCSHASPGPSEVQPVHGLQEEPPSCRPDRPPESLRPWPQCSSCLHSRTLAGLGRGLAGDLRGQLTTCFPRQPGLAAISVSCSSARGAQAARSGLRGPASAAASFELPTPLWSLYMPPEETVSTA